MTCREEIEALIEQFKRAGPRWEHAVAELALTLADRIDKLEALGRKT